MPASAARRLLPPARLCSLCPRALVSMLEGGLLAPCAPLPTSASCGHSGLFVWNKSPAGNVASPHFCLLPSSFPASKTVEILLSDAINNLITRQSYFLSQFSCPLLLPFSFELLSACQRLEGNQVPKIECHSRCGISNHKTTKINDSVPTDLNLFQELAQREEQCLVMWCLSTSHSKWLRACFFTALSNCKFTCTYCSASSPYCCCFSEPFLALNFSHSRICHMA